jgi:FkbM family methyltransferase
MILNTRRLFKKLLGPLEVDAIFDVGSMDGADAMQFRAAAPAARIYAFEPHPGNFGSMQRSDTLRAGRIVLVPLAATNFDGEAEFFLVPEGYVPCEGWRGMSSLHRRVVRPESLTPVRVKTSRLDTFVMERSLRLDRLALWIDAEGKGYEVIEGSAGLVDRVQLIHIETETSACIADGQRLYPDLKATLESHGFMELATDQRTSNAQFNVLFIRPVSETTASALIIFHTATERLRYLAIQVLRTVCPGCISRMRGYFPGS